MRRASVVTAVARRHRYPRSATQEILWSALGILLTFVPADAVHVDTPDSLFEYFLIDPQTQPPVETSRIRLALSTVQLFIERVVRNLEPPGQPGGHRRRRNGRG